MDVFAMRGAILSSAHQFHAAYPYHSLHGKHGFSVEGLQTDCYVETPLILLGVNWHAPGVDPSLFGVDLILPSLTLHWNLLQNRSSSSHRRRQL